MGRRLTLLALAPSLSLLGCQSTLPSCEAAAPAGHADYALVEYRLLESTCGWCRTTISRTR